MAPKYKYTTEELKRLRESPLVVKPPGLPPAEQWMGSPQDSRNSTKTIDGAKTHDSNNLLDQTNRRPQHITRNSANPEDIILGPPKTSFLSSTSRRNENKATDASDRPPIRDGDPRDRFNFRNKTGDGETERLRDSRNILRPKRAEGDQDSDGWSTVKPRKSFGTEGAERFNGRMGVDRHGEVRRFKDRDDRDPKERLARGFENFNREARDKDIDNDQEREPRRNGIGRGRNESWFRGDDDAPAPAARERNSNGDKFANRGWRIKNNDEAGRINKNDGRWNRHNNDRNEIEPEWNMSESAEEKPQGHSQEKSQGHSQAEFMKWKEAQHMKDRGIKTSAEEQTPESGGGFFGLDKPKIETPMAIETGPDKFFGMWAAPKDESGPVTTFESKKESAAKAKAAGKASRFTSFFTPSQEEPPRKQPEPPQPAPAQQPSGLGALLGGDQTSEDKQAFEKLLQKLQLQPRPTTSGTSTPTNGLIQPKLPPSEKQRSQNIPPQDQFQHYRGAEHQASQPNHNEEPFQQYRAPERQQSQPNTSREQFQQYRPERQEDARPSVSSRNSQQALAELLSQRQVAGSQSSIRPEKMLQDLVGQRQNAPSQSSLRPDSQTPNNNNVSFLMNLMKGQPAPQRTEQAMLRMPGPKPADRQMEHQMDRQSQMERMQQHQQMMERDQQEAARERSASQRQARPPPGFFDDSFQRGPPPQHERPLQPTQILQRPPPPGLDQMPPGWAPPSQLPPPQQLRQQQQQHIAPPPGFAGRGMPPMPQGMLPPGFPGMGNFPPPDVMASPRGMPPPGFYQAPPPGFMPPGFQGGPDGMSFGGPYDGRGPPPNGFRRQ